MRDTRAVWAIGRNDGAVEVKGVVVVAAAKTWAV